MNIQNISEEHLFEVLKYQIPEGWEVYSYRITEWFQEIKIRTLYSENELKFNEDGYKYKNLYLDKYLTKQYLKLIELGYTVII